VHPVADPAITAARLNGASHPPAAACPHTYHKAEHDDVFGLNSCVLAPYGTREEHAKLTANSPLFEPPIETRQLPELPAQVDWRAALQRAFLANGELESAYFEWKAALTRIVQASTWPNSNVAVSFS
jgi:hypothetical protein